ncbi:MAG: hypothetical protein ACRD2O_15605 [Terriglobia bacterium]
MKSILMVFALMLASGSSGKILTVDLKPETVAAFEHYVKTAEVRITEEETHPDAFLYFDSLPTSGRPQVKASLQHGQISIKKLTVLDASGHAIEAPGGLIHHWLGILFIPGVSIQPVLGAVQDYAHEQDHYRPQVIRARLISHQGNEFEIYLRLQEKKIITVTLDTEHEVRYSQLDRTRWSSRSYSTRIREVRNAGEKDEYLLPVGLDGGFLWRINSYWRFEESDGGVYVQCESISLTRDIPTGLGWMLEPFVTSVPRQTLQATLEATRAVVLARHRSNRGPSGYLSRPQ